MSSSSAAAAGAAAEVDGPYAVCGFEASPGRVACSASYDWMCLYQRAVCGYEAASGAEGSAL